MGADWAEIARAPVGSNDCAHVRTVALTRKVAKVAG